MLEEILVMETVEKFTAHTCQRPDVAKPPEVRDSHLRESARPGGERGGWVLDDSELGSSLGD